jgi:Putative transposase of IS4/5 family (DUF4096)
VTKQWAMIEPLLPQVNTGDRPEKHPRRAVANAILYVVRTGSTGDMWDDETRHGRPSGAGPRYSTTASAATRRRSIGQGKHRGASRSTTIAAERPVGVMNRMQASDSPSG